MFQIVANIISFSNKSKKIDIFRVATNIISLYINIKRKIEMFQKVANIMSFSNKSKKNDIFIDAANIISLCNKRKETNILTIKAEKMNVRPISFMPKKKNLDIRIFNELRTQILHSEPSFLRDEESFRREDPWMTTFSERRSLNLRRRERYSAMFPTPSSTFISNLCRSEREVAPSIRYFLL